MKEEKPSSRGMAVLCLLGLLGFGIYGTWFWLSRDTGPGAGDFGPAAQYLRAAHRPGDLILLVPSYATRAREHLGDLGPLALRDPLSEDMATNPRVWVFGLFGQAEALRPRFQARGLVLESEKSFPGGITVDLYRTGATARTTFDFVAELKRARVYHEKDGKETACDRWLETNGQGGDYGRWSCPYDSEWFYVAPEWHRMGDHLRLCLWAHPPHQGRLVVRFEDVPLSGQLWGRAGHTLNSSVHARERVFLDVQVGEAATERLDFALDDYFRPFAMSTPSTGTATVSFAVSSPDAGANHFCFVAQMRGPG